MANYRITNLAKSDLESIWDYTVNQWSISQAEKYIDGLLTSFDAIADGKTRGKSIDYIREGYKKALYGRHIIFYRSGSDQIIEIIRVLHVSMDIHSKLTEE